MLSLLIIGLVLVGQTQALIDGAQIKGFKKLLKHLNGTYMTCHIILFSEMVDYETADNNCKTFDIGSGTQHNGNLATVNDEEKNEDLTLLLAMAYDYNSQTMWADDQWVWAGLRKVRNNYGTTHTKTYNVMDWEWANGDNPTEYEKWMAGMPDQRMLTRQGVVYYQNQMRINHKGKWDDTFTYKTHPYACDYRGKYILSTQKVTWLKANETCEEAGLMLAKVRSGAEVNEMKRLIKHFMGDVDPTLRIFHPDNWIWLGGNDLNPEGEWKWTDGSYVEDFYGMSWRVPNPDDAQYIGQTGQDAMSFSKWGEFDDSFTHTRKRAFACQCPDS